MQFGVSRFGRMWMTIRQNMDKYDQIGMYPKVRRLIAMGDLHGDLRVTLQALRLAKVIPDDIFPYNVDKISWCGGGEIKVTPGVECLSLAISSVTLKPGNCPPSPGLAPCAIFISISFALLR